MTFKVLGRISVDVEVEIEFDYEEEKQEYIENELFGEEVDFDETEFRTYLNNKAIDEASYSCNDELTWYCDGNVGYDDGEIVDQGTINWISVTNND